MARAAPNTDPADAFDAFELARSAARRAAHTPIARLGRLAATLVDGRGEVAWSIDGRSARRPDGGRDLYLDLRIAATVRMRCVRCLQPVECPLEVARTLRLARTEAQAEREDLEALDDDDVDVIAGSERFAPLDLVEDEALLALPLAPRHADCRLPGGGRATGPSGEGASQAAEADAPVPARSPFAALATLVRRRPGDGAEGVGGKGGGDKGVGGTGGGKAGEPDGSGGGLGGDAGGDGGGGGGD